ncbi:hypothetical protein F8271_30330 [Micromonospora sp. ALFpr18c]|uniref:hypothetical protein n=1 Tax=Micromonospora sp. ALFpr18c TaxID=1458665 RepID=UPI00124BBA03|nr:hypothetical protein [Micromonospora sp. ALFpr18c]KAB1926086.1 hypothetical protein F8271_30330 [Micromonospora sp. ALFpr18c]
MTLPDGWLTVPLKRLAVLDQQSARLPQQWIHYIERTEQHVRDLGGKLPPGTQDAMTSLNSLCSESPHLVTLHGVPDALLKRLEAGFMAGYVDALRRAGVGSDPTVADLMKFIFARVGTAPKVVVWTPLQKWGLEKCSEAMTLGQNAQAQSQSAGNPAQNWGQQPPPATRQTLAVTGMPTLPRATPVPHSDTTPLYSYPTLDSYQPATALSPGHGPGVVPA